MDGFMIPLKDRVVIEQHAAEEKTKSGIIIPDAEKPNLGKVLYIGSEVKELAVGDVVVLGSKWFTNFKHQGVDLLIVNEADVLGKIIQ
jgi:chaperonin GroES